MSERTPTTAQGRLNSFDKRKDAAAHKRYLDEVLGDAGATDFSLEARQKLEDLAAYDTYMQRFSKDQRDPLDRHIDAVESGAVESKEVQQDPHYRRIAKLALDIAQMEANGDGHRVADKTGKTVLDYRKERLQELQSQYNAVRPADSTVQGTESTAQTNNPDVAEVAQADLTSNGTEQKAQTSEAVKEQESQQSTAAENEDTRGPILDAEIPEEPELHSSDEHDVPKQSQTVDSNEKVGESDPYQEGKYVRIWMTGRSKDSKKQTSDVNLVIAKIAKRSEDGESFTVEAEDVTGNKFTETLTRKQLDASKVVPIMEYAHNDDKSLKRDEQGRLIPLGWKQWTITEGPDENGWFRLNRTDKDGKEESIVMHRASLELKLQDFKAIKQSGDSPQTSAPQGERAPAPTPEDVKKAQEFAKGFPKGEASVSPTRKSTTKPSSVYPLGENTKRRLKKFEKIARQPGLTAQFERDTAAIRRAFNNAEFTRTRKAGAAIRKVMTLNSKPKSTEEIQRDGKKANGKLAKASQKQLKRRKR